MFVIFTLQISSPPSPHPARGAGITYQIKYFPSFIAYAAKARTWAGLGGKAPNLIMYKSIEARTLTIKVLFLFTYPPERLKIEG